MQRFVPVKRFVKSVFAAGLAIATASPVVAQPRLVSVQPAEGSVNGQVSQLAITFSEPLVAAASGIDVVMTGMPGMAHHQPMKMTGVKVSIGADGVTLIAKLARALPTGSYEAAWHVASADAQRVAGKVAFTVQ